MIKITEIYKRLIVERKMGEEWIESYKNTVEEVSRVKGELEKQNGMIDNPEIYKSLPRNKSYEAFMLNFIYSSDNGVASAGQSKVKKELFLELIKQDGFKKLITEIIKNPNENNFKEFRTMWKNQFPTNNPVLTNRVYSAVKPESFSSIVDEYRFFKAASLLSKNYNLDLGENDSWYAYSIKIAEFLNKELDEIIKDDPDKYFKRNMFFWFFSEINKSQMSIKKQTIKYGAPGTGKTYSCKEDAKNSFLTWQFNCGYENNYKVDENIQVVQFHPSFTYEDFFEGIRPVINNGKTELKLKNGVFKEFCKKAGQWEISLYNERPELKEKKWKEITVSDLKGNINSEIWSFLDKVEDESLFIDAVIPPYYFIIDEINRAELSRVLGELMYCLEYRGYRGKIKTQYSELSDLKENYFFEENGENFFFVPNNVVILGTMNNIDRSVDSFDFALRRRFSWEEVEPDSSLILNHPKRYKYIDEITDGYEKMNEKIASDPLLGKDYRIGHSYLMNLPEWMYSLSKKQFKETLWEELIKPLIEEYLRGSSEFDKLEDYRKVFLGVSK